MYPMKFNPIYKEKIWAGNRLGKFLSRDEEIQSYIGESWEISCFENYVSVVSNGKFKGKSLDELISIYKNELVGISYDAANYKFPLLIKYIDAGNRLSVQVHPSHIYTSEKNKKNGKNEVWYVLECSDNAEIIYGVKEGVTNKDIKDFIENHASLDVFEKIKIKPGDIIYVPSGTIHALLGDVLVLEIQESSDVTYRLYDWNRKDIDGNYRELHVEQALKVMNLGSTYEKNNMLPTIYENKDYAKESYKNINGFNMDIINVKEKYKEELIKENFEIIICVSGCGKVHYNSQEECLKKGDLVFMPASLEKYIISGPCKIIKAYV